MPVKAVHECREDTVQGAPALTRVNALGGLLERREPEHGTREEAEGAGSKLPELRHAPLT